MSQIIPRFLFCALKYVYFDNGAANVRKSDQLFCCICINGICVMKIKLARFLKIKKWNNLRTLKPISNVFGLDRGVPIDRFFIERFLDFNQNNIKGRILEVENAVYSRRFSSPGSTCDILHYSDENPNATIIGDLTNLATLPYEEMDCFICTQTLNFIYDVKSAITGIHYVLKNNGVALVTVAGICQVSRYDMDKWGDYWRFTDLSIRKLFEDVFGSGNVEVDYCGNVLVAVSFLHGLAADELTIDELLYKDRNYPILLTVVAKKCSA